MGATILSSPRAIEVSVYVVRAFVRLRELAAMHGTWPSGWPSWKRKPKA
jgi:hypothetical protein